MRAIIIFLSILSFQAYSQNSVIPSIDQKESFLKYAKEVSNFSNEEFQKFGEEAVEKFNKLEGNDLLDIYRFAHAFRNPDTAFVVGTIVYHRTSSTVKIPSSAKITGESEYTSGGYDVKSYELKDRDGKYYSITFNKDKYEVISRFVNSD